MKTLDKTVPEEGPEALSPEEIAKRIVDCKVAVIDAEKYYKELEAEMLNRLGDGETLEVNYPFVIHTGEVVDKTVTVRHQHREGLVYDEGQVIRQLKETFANPYAEGLVYTEQPKDRLERKIFEKELFTNADLFPLQRLTRRSHSDWCVVTGVPK